MIQISVIVRKLRIVVALQIILGLLWSLRKGVLGSIKL